MPSRCCQKCGSLQDSLKSWAPNSTHFTLPRFLSSFLVCNFCLQLDVKKRKANSNKMTSCKLFIHNLSPYAILYVKAKERENKDINFNVWSRASPSFASGTSCIDNFLGNFFWTLYDTLQFNSVYILPGLLHIFILFYFIYFFGHSEQLAGS